MKKCFLFFVMCLLLGAACFSAPQMDAVPSGKASFSPAAHQSCAQAGYCYRPVKAIETSQFPQATSKISLFSFFGFGLLMAFTPCVLPMVPILSGIILGRKNLSSARAFLLSLFYVFGMALVYAAIGFFFGLLGQNIQIIFQNTYIILGMAGLIALMALSLFGVFTIQLPEKWRGFIARKSEHQKRGTYVGAFLMGGLSTLILSPCVTPVLVAALSYIGQTGGAGFGGVGLFLMGLGSGMPLLLLGLLGPKILPKPGRWMTIIKMLMGVLLLSVAVMTAMRVVDHEKSTVLPFQIVHSVAEIETALKNHPKDTIMLDFYANWCVSCHEMDKITFSHSTVQQKLRNMVLLRVDITQNSLENAAIMRHYAVIAPPTIIFFRGGAEIPNTRIIGYIPPEKFINLLPSAAN